jgi:bacterioferritin
METTARPQTAVRNNGISRDKFETGNEAKSDDFSVDLNKLRDTARRDVEQGAITPTYTANRLAVLKMLNEALATELVCVLRYKRHQFVASGIHSEPVAKEFAQHALQEQGHADAIAARIIQLGGQPDFSPDRMSGRSHSEYSESTALRSMIEEDLIAERIAIDSYREMIRYLGDRDPTTRRMLEEILSVEEEHAKDMADLLDRRNSARSFDQSA